MVDLLLLLLVICIPFEFRATPPRLTELQILFFLLMLAAAPSLLRNRRELLSNRVVVAALLFVTIMWISAVLSAETVNAMKAAVRYTAGVGLLCVVLQSPDTKTMRQAWTVAAMAASIYGLLDYWGYGYPILFRGMEFYAGDVRRLSGSFEYPNTAAAYYALSLPILWESTDDMRARVAWSAVVWAALLLTFSRGALIAVVGITVLWAMRTRSWRPMGLVLVGALVFALTVLYQPLLLRRFSASSQLLKTRNAEYRVPYNRIQERPGTAREMPVTIKNSGRETWPSRGDQRVTLSYHWYDTGEKKILETPSMETLLPRDVRTGESIDVVARFQTPESDGLYLLDWDLKYPPYNWFSTTDAVLPVVVEAEISANKESSRGNVDVSSWYKTSSNSVARPATPPPRAQLWRAALVLFAEHPLLGIGPDNYRLSYGRVLNLDRWESDLHSNNLYLEILAGSGSLGLLAFLFLLSRIPWRRFVTIPALGVALLHGVFDFFLMATPLYFAFWILVGEASQAGTENSHAKLGRDAAPQAQRGWFSKTAKRSS